MATVINNPDTSGSGGGMGMVLSVLLVIVVIVLFFVYGLPAMRGTNRGTTVNVPDQVDINVNDGTK